MQIIKFKTENKYYLYDVNTNNILMVDKPIWLCAGKKDKSHIFNKEFSEIELDNSFRIINNLKEKECVFLDNSPLKGFKYHLSIDEIYEKLNNNLRHIVLDITEQCNFRCQYCKFGGTYHYARKHSKNKMTQETALRSIDFFLKRSTNTEVLKIGFYGGEPLTNFDLIKTTVNYIKEKTDKKISFSLTINGSLLDEEKINFFVTNDISLLISLDGPKIIHDRYRRTINNEPTFNNILKNIELIKYINNDYYMNKVGFSVVISPPYSLDEIVDFFIKESIYSNGPIVFSNIDSHDTSFFDNFNSTELRNSFDSQYDVLKKEFIILLSDSSNNDSFKRKRILFDLFGRRFLPIHHRYIFPMDEYLSPGGICTPGLRRLFITYDGKLGLCEKMNKSWFIGDIYNGFNMESIDRLLKEQIEINTKLCKDCWALRLCNTCYIQSMNGDEMSYEQKKRICSSYKRDTALALIEYSKILETNPKAFDSIKTDLDELD
jgi:uncharacterized protein